MKTLLTLLIVLNVFISYSQRYDTLSHSYPVEIGLPGYLEYYVLPDSTLCLLQQHYDYVYFQVRSNAYMLSRAYNVTPDVFYKQMLDKQLAKSISLCIMLVLGLICFATFDTFSDLRVRISLFITGIFLSLFFVYKMPVVITGFVMPEVGAARDIIELAKECHKIPLDK